MCIFHSLELFFFSSFYRMKSLWVILQAGPAIYQRWAKHTQMEKFEWMMCGFYLRHRGREERDRKDRRAAVRGAVEEGGEIDGPDIHAVKWEQLIDNLLLSHHIAPIRAASLINLRRADVFTPQLLSSVWLFVRQAVQTSFLLALSLFSPVCPPSPLPSLPRAKLRTASNLTPGFQSLFSWASYRINPLLVLIDVRVTSSPRGRSGNNVWSTSQSLLKREQDGSCWTQVTNKPTIIFRVTVMVKT